MELPFHPEALAELRAAVVYLNDERPGHGQLLYERVKLRVAQARRFPKSGPAMPGLSERHDVRRFGVSRLHCQIVTALIAGERMVASFAHEAREPGYWKGRVGG